MNKNITGQEGDSHALTANNSDAKKSIGIVMPIAASDGCDEAHWSEVRDIITQAAMELGHTVSMVSDAVDIGVIQKRIVHRIYSDDLIICDVSGKNPNVMFELGLRIAFDKPVILIKDDSTPYSFDTSPIQHLNYRRDLRFSSVNMFKDELKSKITSCLNSSGESSFLSSFGPIKIAAIPTKQVEKDDLIFDILRNIQADLVDLRATQKQSGHIIDESQYKSILNSRKSGRINTYITKSAEALTADIIGEPGFKCKVEIIGDNCIIGGLSNTAAIELANAIRLQFPHYASSIRVTSAEYFDYKLGRGEYVVIPSFNHNDHKKIQLIVNQVLRK